MKAPPRMARQPSRRRFDRLLGPQALHDASRFVLDHGEEGEPRGEGGLHDQHVARAFAVGAEAQYGRPWLKPQRARLGGPLVEGGLEPGLHGRDQCLRDGPGEVAVPTLDGGVAPAHPDRDAPKGPVELGPR